MTRQGVLEAIIDVHEIDGINKKQGRSLFILRLDSFRIGDVGIVDR